MALNQVKIFCQIAIRNGCPALNRYDRTEKHTNQSQTVCKTMCLTNNLPIHNYLYITIYPHKLSENLSDLTLSLSPLPFNGEVRLELTRAARRRTPGFIPPGGFHD